MNFAFDHELLLLRDSVRRFVQEDLMPLGAQYANEPDIPDTLRQCPPSAIFTQAR